MRMVNDLFEILNLLERVNREKAILSNDMQDLTTEFQKLDELEESVQKILSQVIIIADEKRRTISD